MSGEIVYPPEEAPKQRDDSAIYFDTDARESGFDSTLPIVKMEEAAGSCEEVDELSNRKSRAHSSRRGVSFNTHDEMFLNSGGSKLLPAHARSASDTSYIDRSTHDTCRSMCCYVLCCVPFRSGYRHPSEGTVDDVYIEMESDSFRKSSKEGLVQNDYLSKLEHKRTSK
jgi:hypothetical protein